MRTLINIQPKSYLRKGTRFHPANSNGVYHADIEPRKSIRIYGVQTNIAPSEWNTEAHGGGKKFDLTFRVGDSAEYDSYNLRYIGTIINIGNNSVTIQAYGNENHRLDLYHFVWRNWDFNLEKIEKYNAEERMCI